MKKDDIFWFWMCILSMIAGFAFGVAMVLSTTPLDKWP